jgi:hypothetical protein
MGILGMSLWALVINGQVHELTALNPAGRFHPQLIWVDVTAVSPQPDLGWTATQSGDTWSFAAPTTPPLSLEQQAASELATRTGAGIAITSTGTPALNATYALDSLTMDQVGSVARDFASGLGLPNNASTFAYPDLTGTLHNFTGTAFVALYKAQRDLIFALNQQSAIMAHGGPPSWPTQTATIP